MVNQDPYSTKGGWKWFWIIVAILAIGYFALKLLGYI
jgi:hypothetical protein